MQTKTDKCSSARLLKRAECRAENQDQYEGQQQISQYEPDYYERLCGGAALFFEQPRYKCKGQRRCEHRGEEAAPLGAHRTHCIRDQQCRRRRDRNDERDRIRLPAAQHPVVPPFGIEWKTSKAAVEAENKKGAAGRFEPGLPAIGDGQQLFLLNGVAKLKDSGRMAIIQNGSPLFKGDAGSGESNIRGYLLENDWLEAIVQLPNDLFYNTGIATYIWVITRNKSAERQGKVQLIDASQCYEKRRKPLGNKRVEITESARQLIMQAYHNFNDDVLTETVADGTEIRVESKVRPNDYFKYSKLFIKAPEKDTEIIPWLTDREEYLQKNVAPYSPNYVIDEKKTKIGYEIPFTREFYKYTPLKPSAEIFEELKSLEQQESELMEKLLH